MQRIVDRLLQARVHMLLIVAGLAMLFISLLDLTDFKNTNIGVVDDFSVVRLTAIAIGALLLLAGVAIYLTQPHQRTIGRVQVKVLNLQGKVIVFTGTLNMEREVLSKQAGRLGATIASQVTSKTDYLIAGAKPGASKIKSAARHRVTVVPAEQWYATVHELSR